MSEEQTAFVGKFCGTCGVRVDGECKLNREQLAECLIGDDRTFWQPKKTDKEMLVDIIKAGRENVEKKNHRVDEDEMVRGKALKKALEIINGERQDSYGNPEDSFALIGEYWTSYLNSAMGLPDGCKIQAREVAEMMALFKIARMTGQKTTFDNYADAAGYIGIAGDLI